MYYSVYLFQEGKVLQLKIWAETLEIALKTASILGSDSEEYLLKRESSSSHILQRNIRK